MYAGGFVTDPARTGLRFNTKLAYGVGQAAEGIKAAAFTIFLLFYFNNVLGLGPVLTGAALMIALVFDAITDPLVGSWSDSLRHKWGRRHPLMYLSALPLAISFALVFNPPSGLGQVGLFLWLTGFSIATRAAMSLYFVPHLALGAELSNDYHERTSIVAFRTFFAYFGGGVLIFVAFVVFFQPTDLYKNGQLNPAGYPGFGVLFGGLMAVSVLLSAWGTHHCIPDLPKPADSQRFSLRGVWANTFSALGNKQFRMFFIGIVIYFVARGIEHVLLLHMGTYFWKLPTAQIKYIPLLALSGVLIGAPLWSVLGRRIEKKPMFLLGIIVFSVIVAGLPGAKMIGAYPGQDSPMYLGLLLGLSFVGGLAGAAALVAAGSMLADITDVHELQTGTRQEGIFFGVLAFAGKAASGLGSQLAGLGLKWADFPSKAEPGTVPESKVMMLGLVYGPGVLIVSFIAIAFLWRFDLDKQAHAKVRAELDRRAAEAKA